MEANEVKQKLKEYALILSTLGNSGIVRTYNSPVGDFAEWLVSTKMNFKLEKNSQKGYDAWDPYTGVKYQVKSRWMHPGKNSRQLNVIRKYEDHQFDCKWNELDWNEYKTKDLAIGIGKQVGYAALQGAAIGVGFDVAQKLWNGEEIKGEEVVETALKSGADFGIKAAAAGAIKVGVEKEVIKVILKGTPASTIANIAFVAVEDAKIVGKMMTGELSVKEGIEKIEQTTVATVAGLVAMGKGATIGAAAGAILGPVGAAIGGFIGGTVGYMAGSKIGETVVKGAQKIRDGACKVSKTIESSVMSTVSTIANGIKSFCSGVTSFFGF